MKTPFKAADGEMANGQWGVFLHRRHLALTAKEHAAACSYIRGVLQSLISLIAHCPLPVNFATKLWPSIWMDYIKSYKSFIYSHHLTEGIRMTIGILMPAFILSFFDLLSVGIIISVGALCVCIPDNAGPIRHRRTAMFVCNLCIFFVALTVGFVAHSPLVLGITLFVYCFFFSMLGVYGLRAGATGLAALLVMVLNMDQRREGWEVVIHSLYILAGGTWYMLLSLALYQVRPYKLAQQALGDCIQSTAEYLRIRAKFLQQAYKPGRKL